jgi:methyl-accepting chemotaxis protein
MSEVAERTSTQATAVAAATEQSTASVETVAAAAEELSASVAEISRQVTESSQISHQAVERAAETDHLVEGLLESTRRIGQVVQLINDIAGQTNLLALNATIEAARAGEAGKGFAVVAGEVKNLANQTARATEQITTQIAAVQTATHNAVSAIQGIGATIGKISEITATIAAAVEEQGAATHEIARNVHEAAAVGARLGGIVAALSATTVDGDATARALLTEAGGLSTQIDSLAGEVSQFVAQVRGGR